MSVPGNKIAWACSIQLQSIAEAERQRFANAEWGPEANAAMIKEFHHLPIPYGGIMGDLIDLTPTDMISKVYLEHKMFETWFYKRTVLIGDGEDRLALIIYNHVPSPLLEAVEIKHTKLTLPPLSAMLLFS